MKIESGTINKLSMWNIRVEDNDFKAYKSCVIKRKSYTPSLIRKSYILKKSKNYLKLWKYYNWIGQYWIQLYDIKKYNMIKNNINPILSKLYK